MRRQRAAWCEIKLKRNSVIVNGKLKFKSRFPVDVPPLKTPDKAVVSRTRACYLSDCEKMITAAAFLLATVAHGEVTTFPVTPSATDPEIKTFNEPHWIYVNRGRTLLSNTRRIWRRTGTNFCYG